MESEADRQFDAGDYIQAEKLYREALATLAEQGGGELAARVQYNLCLTLSMQRKYEQAIPLLRGLATSLSARTDRYAPCPVSTLVLWRTVTKDELLHRHDASHFGQQEVGALRLLAEALNATGETEEADKVLLQVTQVESAA
jgi:tetratricopeptide (TPR) repeat protein